MNARTLKSVLATLAVAVLTLARTASAEESIIKHPGDHPNYAVEIEPHLDFTFFDVGGGADGWGLGGRFSIPIVKNGFVSSINNSVAIGFGLDWLSYGGCYHYGRWARGYAPDCGRVGVFWAPVVMQWNFFLSTHWSVFGEPGLAFHHSSWSAQCPGVDNAGRLYTYDCGDTDNGIDFAFFAGGRYHFSESMALTMRIGSPYFSVGLSFL